MTTQTSTPTRTPGRTPGDSSVRAALDAIVPSDVEVPDAATCLRAAKLLQREGDLEGAWCWAVATVEGGDDFTAWMGAVRILDECRGAAPVPRRSVRVAVLGSATTAQF